MYWIRQGSSGISRQWDLLYWWIWQNEWLNSKYSPWSYGTTNVVHCQGWDYLSTECSVSITCQEIKVFKSAISDNVTFYFYFSRTSILAAANPIGSNWNTKKTVVENVHLPHTLLSRWDHSFLYFLYFKINCFNTYIYLILILDLILSI